VNGSLTDLAARAEAMADRCEHRVPHTPGHRHAVAALGRAANERARQAAVAVALDDGMSWTAIALVLDQSTAECRARYGTPRDDRLAAPPPEDAA